MTDLRPFHLGMRLAEFTNVDDVVDKSARAGIRFDGSSAAALVVLGLFVGASSDNPADLLAAVEPEPGGMIISTLPEKGK